MNCCQCQGIERQFDAKFAQQEIKRYRKKGLRKTSRMLVDGLRDDLGEARTLLDIGGGIGGIQLELLKSGLEKATSIDASAAFVDAARAEAARQELDDHIEYHHADFVDAADRVGEADIVTLDRVICCYHDMPNLVRLSAERARTNYALVYPRDEWWTRVGVAAANVWLQLGRSSMRTFVHPSAEVDAVVRRQGFRMHGHRTTAIWRVDIYRR
jgi:magnesium-protoporphyrin O-methyltransferase